MTDVRDTTALHALLAGGETATDGTTTAYHISDDWMQGRTAFGGLSTAIALDAALRAFPGDAPLRSAQIGFVGPVGGHAQARARLLRRSKASQFVAVDVESEPGYGVNALFAFMSARDSSIDHSSLPGPDVVDPGALRAVPDHPLRPAFTRKMDMRPVDDSGRIALGSDTADVTMWVRWVEEPDCPATVRLLALADAPPPAAMPLAAQFGPISSSTWTHHFLTDEPETEDGWWLLKSWSSHARRGFSPQTMAIWNSRRELMCLGNQGVALYV